MYTGNDHPTLRSTISGRSGSMILSTESTAMGASTLLYCATTLGYRRNLDFKAKFKSGWTYYSFKAKFKSGWTYYSFKR